MSGHSKWSTIKHRKGALDAKRGKIFTKHAKLISIAAQRGGGDPNMNPSLRAAIDSAKTDNVPNLNIDRAIKRGAGELKDGNIIEELVYEGYGPYGVALIIECLTDNKNRTVASVKNIVSKAGGNIGESGCVAWMFKRRGVVCVKPKNNKDEIGLDAIELGAEDIKEGGDIITIYTTVENFKQVFDGLKKRFDVESGELEMVPDNQVKIEDVEKVKKLIQLIDTLEGEDDVSDVWVNFDIPQEIIDKLNN